MPNMAFEEGVNFAYKHYNMLPLHPKFVATYSLSAIDRDCFLSGYITVLNNKKV